METEAERLARELENARQQLAAEVATGVGATAHDVEARRIQRAAQLAVAEERLNRLVILNAQDIRMQAQRVDVIETWRQQQISSFLLSEWKPSEARELLEIVRQRRETRQARRFKNLLPVLVPTITAVGVVYLQWRLSH